MKKYIYIILTFTIIFSLSACSAASQVAAGGGSNSAAAGQPAAGAGQASQSQSGQRETPLAMKLALGTFKLEDTDYAVDASQAKTLLTLWKAALALSQSETTASAEMEAVIDQIQSAMTPAQMAAINGMNLSFADMRTIAEEMGVNLGGAGGFGNITPEMQATMQAMRQSGQGPAGGLGGMPGGGPPMDGGGPGGGFGGEANSTARQTAMAGSGGMSRVGLGLPPALLEALIKFLEARAQS